MEGHSVQSRSSCDGGLGILVEVTASRVAKLSGKHFPIRLCNFYEAWRPVKLITVGVYFKARAEIRFSQKNS